MMKLNPLAPGRFAKYAAVGFVSLLTVGCAPHKQSSSERNHVTEFGFATEPERYGDVFDWQKKSPAEFLEMLKKSGATRYTVVGYHVGWIQSNDLPALIQKLDSTVECASVVSVHSSQVPVFQSTESHEAAYIIEGFRRGRFPPSLSSAEYQFDIDEIRAWFADMSSTDSTNE